MIAGCESLEARLLLSAAAPQTFVPPLLAVDASTWDSQSLLIRIDPADASSAELAELHAAWSAQPAALEFGGAGLQVVHLAEGVSVIDALAAYQAHPAVAYAEPNYRVSLSITPDDPQFGSLWGLHNTGQTGGTPDADIDALEAWDISTGSGSVVVAVIDTGVDHTHPDLAPNMWVNAGEIAGDGIDNDGNGYIDDVHGFDFINRDGDPRDDHNHGTHVAGTIGAAGHNGLGVAGVNWDVQIMALKFLGADGSGSIADAIEALDYAVAHGARISNNSWGFNGDFSQALYDAVALAREVGHIFVAAAGNGNAFGFGQDNDANPFWPANLALDNVVSVAAVDHHDQLPIFSNYGETTVDLAAPGVNILSTTRGGTYGTSSGTSMAAPHVSGALALLLDRHPDWTHGELIERLLETVDPVVELDGMTVTGGRLNVFEALVAGVAGSRVLSHSPLKSFDPVSSVRVKFSEPMAAATFTLDDVASFTGPLGTINATAVQPVENSDGREFDIVFAEQAEFGTYELVFGPEIFDLDGEPMNQDADQTTGEPLDDRYTAVFAIEPFSAFFDFGTATSAVEAGYVRVVPETTYTAEHGFGWQAGSVAAATRSNGTALTRDLNFGSDMTFAVDMAAAVYDVTLTMGDTGGYAHQDMAVFLEGVHVATLSTAAGEVVTRTYQASVADGQLTVRLVDLGGSDPNAVINGLAVRLVGPDVQGPRIIAAESSGPAPRTIDRVTLLFNEPLAAGTFTLDDVATLSGPNGPIAPTAVHPLDDFRYEVVFPVQDAAGEYTLVVGPDVSDAAGNALDQDGDGTPGEPLDDQFTASFTIEPFSAFFDFGTATSEVEPDYVGVAAATTYTAERGFGWQAGSVAAATRSSGTALTRDLNFGSDMTFAVDMAAAVYDVTLTIGDTGGYAHQDMAVFLEGVHVATLSTAAGEVVTSTYQASVADGQLTVRLVDLGGSDPNAVINGLAVRLVGPDVQGPRIIAAESSGPAPRTIDRVTLLFNEPLAAGTFTLDDVATLSGPNGPIAPTAVHPLDDLRYEVVFPVQEAAGEYTLVVGPDLFDAAGNALDQDGDGTPGEPLDDQFTASFTIEPFSGSFFDFGTASSPVEAGYTAIDPADTYNADAGFGWLSGAAVRAISRSTGTALTHDLNFSTDATFAVDVPDGLYDVKLIMGDAGAFAHDQMGVFLEGAHVATLSTAAGEVVTPTYQVSVADGQLTLRLVDLGGSDANTVINGLEISTVGPDLTGPQVVATDPAGNVSGSVERIVLDFSESIQDGSFTLADVVTLAGPAGAITPTAVGRLSPTRYEILFPAQDDFGEYTLVVGPEILDAAGNALDQDGDGLNGELLDDRFSLTFALEPFSALFDFGTAGSPVAGDFLRVSHTTAYAAQTGYGWQSGTVNSIDRTSGTALTRDLNYTALAVFVVDVPSDVYRVTLTMGDTGPYGHDQMGVFLEGAHVETVSTAAGQVVSRTYEIGVTDGQLTLLLDDLGGSDKNVVINGLVVVPLEEAVSSIAEVTATREGTGGAGAGDAALGSPATPQPAQAAFGFAPGNRHPGVDLGDRLLAAGSDARQRETVWIAAGRRLADPDTTAAPPAESSLGSTHDRADNRGGESQSRAGCWVLDDAVDEELRLAGLDGVFRSAGLLGSVLSGE